FGAVFGDYANRRWGSSEDKIAGHPIWEFENTASLLKLDGNRTVWLLASERETLPTILEQFE
ncbi:MAG: hypothetical protein ACOCYU_08670, partial [Brevefilum sp.]